MLISTTSTLDGKPIKTYLGLVSGEAILGANAIVGVDLDYENVGQSGGMLMVSASGTAVVYE